MSDFHAQVASIQQGLKAPKGQFNTFGKYAYRNLEDILEAVKPLLGGLILTINDDIVAVEGRVYVKATATLTDGTNVIGNTAYAREAITKKGMDESQITGAASSYARKYALGGLLLCDDNRDANSHTVSQEQQAPATITPDQIQQLAGYCYDKGEDGSIVWSAVGQKMAGAYNIQSLDQLPSAKFSEALSRCQAAANK